MCKSRADRQSANVYECSHDFYHHFWPLLDNSGGDDDSRIEASGASSRIAFPALTTLTGGSSIYHLAVSAQGGGEVDLSAVTTIPGGATQLVANGSGSVVDFSSLTEWVDDAFDPSLAEELNGGEIVVTNLTTIVDVELRFNAASMSLKSGWAESLTAPSPRDTHNQLPSRRIAPLVQSDALLGVLARKGESPGAG